MAGGRPTKYDDSVIEKSLEYLSFFLEPDNRPEKFDELVPTVVGLCRHIERSKAIVYDWAKQDDKQEFSDILCQIEECQHMKLVNGGLAGQYNPAITKMMLTKHGYSDRVESDITSGGEKLQHPGYVIVSK